MNSIVVTSTKQNIKFGYEGEDNVTKIIFPYDESWLEYGEGNFEVRILRCGDEVAYTATEVVDDRQAMTLTMTVTDIELSVRGRGEMQLCYVCPDSIKKSPIYQYTVNRSVDYKYAVDPPEGSIIASVEKSLSEIKNTTNRLSNSVISIESSIDDVNSQIDNINDKISEFDEEIDSIGEVETRVDNLETSIQSINGRINTAEGNINENTESISDLNESVTELENRKVTDLETSGGRSDSGKYLTVGTDGKIKATSLTIPPTITVDASLSTTSTNPVQNKVIKTELNNINSNIEACNTEISKINGSLGLLESGYKTFTQEDIVQGTYNADGSVRSNSNRIRIQGFIELNARETLSFKPGANVAGMLYGTFNENKVFQKDSAWYTEEYTITADKHMYIICVFKNSTGTSIAPIDFDAVVTKTLSVTNNINSLNEILEISISPTSDDIIENRFITTNGNLSPETDDANATDYLKIVDIVSDYLTITCTVYGYAGFAIYDANRSALLSVTGNNSASYNITPSTKIQTFIIQKPAGAYYIRLSAWKTAYTDPSNLKIKGNGFGNLNSRLSIVEREIDSVDTGTLSDKKVLVIGDSISTDAYGSYRKWVTDLINTGFFDGEKVTNSSQHATGFVARYDNQPNDFITRLKAIENPSQYDIVVIFGGINDYIQNIPMGEETGTDYTVSFKPAVNEFFNYLIENFTQARLCVLLPLRTYATWQNSVDEYQQAYSDYIKSVAKTYCLPVLNLTEDSGFFPWKTTFRSMWTLIPQGYDNGDGVHPNEAYQSKYLAPMIKHFLKGLI